MNQLLPFLLLDQEGENEDNSDALMMMMLMNPDSLNDPSSMLPLMLLNDGEDADMKSMFLMTSMMQKDCNHETGKY